MIPSGRVLAVDPGRVRIGLAVSDPMRTIAQTLPTVRASNRQESLEAVAEIVRDKEVAEIVVGRPINLDGTRTVMTGFAERYARDLGLLTGAPVHFWDERLSSVEAERALIEGDVRRIDRARVRDGVAAALMLQGFLELASSGAPT